jgi:nucleoside-diphosphate-sugar epimerase
MSKKKTILVTGAAGMIGGHIALELMRRKADVLAVVRHREMPDWIAPKPPNIVADLSNTDEALAPYRGKIDSIIHCAATSEPPPKKFETLFADNVSATERLLNWAIKYEVRKFILIGAISSFGRVAGALVSPNTPDVLPDAYGRTKALAEEVVRSCAANPETLVLRIPGTVGRGATRSFLPRVLSCAQSGQAIHATNPSALFNNIIHVEDLAQFIADLLGCQFLPSARLLTLGAQEPMSIKDIIQMIVSRTNSKSRVIFDGEPRHAFQIDYRLACQSYGYNPARTKDILERWLASVSMAMRTGI